MKIFKEENYEKIFKDLEIGEELFEKLKFIKCEFKNCTFEKTKFISCKFNECLFDHSTLINLNLSHSVFDEVHFEQTKVLGISWGEIRDFHTKLNFEKSKIQYCSFINLELLDFKISESKVYEVDFSNCKLENSIWDETDLERTNFIKCNLKNADFSTAKNYSISVKENYFKNTKFSYPEISNSIELLGIKLTNN